MHVDLNKSNSKTAFSVTDLQNSIVVNDNCNVSHQFKPISSINTVKDNRQINILHQNIQHFASRRLALEIVLEDLKPDLLILSEHKLNSNEMKFAKVNNYSVISSYCRQTCGGGGVMILSHDSIQVKKLTIPKINELCLDKAFECCSVICRLDNIIFVLVGLYRTPGVVYDNIFLEKLDLTLIYLTKIYDNVVLAGDININVLNTSSTTYEKLCNLLNQHNMQYLVNFPTRVTIECESAIDNIITNLPNELLSVEGVITELSDHDAQMLKVTLKPKKPTSKTYTKHCRKFTKENIDLFKKNLSTETWSELYNASVEAKYDVFHNILTFYFDKCFPLVKSRIHLKTENWVNSNLIKEKEEIKKLSHMFRCTKDKAIKRSLKQKKSAFNSKVYSSKKAFIENKIKYSDNICKSTWKIINKEIKNDNSVKIDNIKLILNGQEYSEPKSVCEIFNNHFINMVDNEVLPNLSPKTPINFVINNVKFHANFITEEQLDKVISSFQNKYSAGFDEIPMPVIKEAKIYLIHPLAHIINSSFVSGIFPNKLKISKIVTLFKKGDKTNPINYRPLSILPAISKIYERVMYLQIVNFLNTNNLFDDEQHGFRVGKSVTTAGIEFIEGIVEAIDKGECATGIFMDISKAFDSVSHDLLITILKNLGVDGVSLKWFKSYISDRHQFVELKFINDLNQISCTKSSLQRVKYGVPQGSILGPVLFLCYIKGLPSVLIGNQSKLCLYADDANLIVTGKTLKEVESSAIQDLKLIDTYFNNKQLLLNLAKTNCINFHTVQNRNKPKSFITIDSSLVSQVNEISFLGLHLDENLSWNKHVFNLLNKISTGLFALKIMSKFCSIDILKTIYFAHIHSHIAFGVVLYGATSNANLLRILRMQKKAIRIMMNLDNLVSVKEYFSKLGILTIYGLFIFKAVMLVRTNGDRLPKLGTTHNYKTRNRHQFAIQNHSTEFYYKKPSSAGIKFINKIPRDLLNINKNNIFKKRLKELLINKSLYSFDEFMQAT